MSLTHNYNVEITWDNDRLGTISSPELNTKIQVATPPEFPKGVEGIWSPEHLFVSAVNTCLMTTFLSIAENSKLNFKTFSCKASGKLEILEGKYIMSEIILKPLLTIVEQVDKEKAERILRKSEAACLISNSIKSKIIFEPKILF